MRCYAKQGSKAIEVEYVKDPMHKIVGLADTFVVKKEEKNRDGIVVPVLSKEIVNPLDNFRQYKVSDFCMENLIAAGAVPTNSMQFTDNDIDGVLSKLDAPVVEDK